MPDPILCDVLDGLCTLTLNRPSKLNALDHDSFSALAKHLDMIVASNGAIDCIILKGAGRSFCAGHDLSSIIEGHESESAKLLQTQYD